MVPACLLSPITARFRPNSVVIAFFPPVLECTGRCVLTPVGSQQVVYNS